MDLTYVENEYWHYLLTLLFYFLPSFLGAFISSSMAKLTRLPTQEKPHHGVLMILFSALVPSILLASSHFYLATVIEQSSLLIGIAFLAGCIGKELLGIVTSFDKLVKFFGLFGKKLRGVKEAVDLVETIVEEEHKREHEEEENEREHHEHDEESEEPDEEEHQEEDNE